MIALTKTFFDHASLEKKLMAMVSLVLCLTMGISSLLGYHLINLKYTKTIYQSMSASSNLISTLLETHLADALQITDTIRADSTLQHHLDLVYRDENYLSAGSPESIYKSLQNLYQQHKKPYLVYAAIINEHFTTYTYGYGYDKLDEKTTAHILKCSHSAHGSAVWIPDSSGQYLFLARQIRKIENLELSDLGTLVIAVDMNVLLNELTKESQNFQNISWYICQGEQTIFSSLQLSKQTLALVRHQTVPCSTVNSQGHTYIVLGGTLTSLQWSYYQLLPYDAATQSRRSVLRIYFIAIAVGVIVALFLLHLSIRKITDHIGILCQKMASFHGDRSQIIQAPYDYSDRVDEIGQLNQYFDSMASEIESLINNEYKLKLNLKNMQLKSLSSQINPHFLYNTLDSINWRAQASGNEDISIMVESLGTLLRSSLSQKQSLITLAEELKLVHRYLLIQKFRYEERLCCIFHINDQVHSLAEIPEEIPLDASIEHILIPPFTIQPLVENSIKYGLERFPGECRIFVEIYTDEEQLHISVKNNGSKFEKDLLDHLTLSESNAQGLGIGLLNINERIHLLFGPEYGLQLYNKDNFATVSIQIPITLQP
jgi:two-component system, sensor histidine kinase YesM